MSRCLKAVGLALVANVAAQDSAISAEMSPVRKVVTLIQEMKTQVDKEASDDMAAYEKYMCWCKTNNEEKTAAITADEARIQELSAFLEEAAAKKGELKSRIGSLQADIAEDQDSLASATANRDKEVAAFLAEEGDMKETRALLNEAIAVLSKVQLLQKSGKPTAKVQEQARAVLMQLQSRTKVGGSAPFAGIMQKDLFDMFGSLEDVAKSRGFLRAGASFEQGGGRLLPWEKTEEQAGAEAKPNGQEGAAAGSKSYNARSGGIVGLLSEMHDQFTTDLASAQKQDFEALVSFEQLSAAKLGEIAAATAAKNDAEADLADTLDQAAKAKEDREATTEAMEADQGFLGTMQKDCASEDEQYKARSKVRGDELVALGETLKILTEDDARDLFGKSVTLLQLSGESAKHSQSSLSAEQAAVQDRLQERVLQHLAAVAKKHKNWALVSLAVRVRLDAFTKVKEVMDKMLAELAMQQKEETEKREFCNRNIDTTEDDIKVSTNKKEDLDQKHQYLVNALESLSRDIEALRTEEEQLKSSLKQAGEQRKEENQVFQQSVTDQRATVNILNKAMKRLQNFYTPSLVEVHAHSQEPNRDGAGRAVEPRPDAPKDYSKSGGAGGVLQLISKIIENAEAAEKELEMDEQHSQALYAELVSATTAAIEANRKSVAEKSTLAAQASADKSETEEAQSSTGEELAKLGELLNAYHLDCDWLVKYYEVRQQARAEEVDAINDAKAVLSGASFGK